MSVSQGQRAIILSFFLPIFSFAAGDFQGPATPTYPSGAVYVDQQIFCGLSHINMRVGDFETKGFLPTIKVGASHPKHTVVLAALGTNPYLTVTRINQSCTASLACALFAVASDEPLINPPQQPDPDELPGDILKYSGQYFSRGIWSTNERLALFQLNGLFPARRTSDGDIYFGGVADQPLQIQLDQFNGACKSRDFSVRFSLVDPADSPQN